MKKEIGATDGPALKGLLVQWQFDDTMCHGDRDTIDAILIFRVTTSGDRGVTSKECDK